MHRFLYSGTALTTVMLIALPFLGSPGSSLEALTGEVENGSRTTVVDTPRDPALESLIAVAESHGADRAAAAAESDGEAGEAGEAGESADTPDAGDAESPGTDPGAPSRPEGDTSGGTAPQPSPSPSSPGAPAPSPSAPAPPAPSPEAPAPPACPAAIGGSTPGAPSKTSPLGVAGTTSGDLQSFAERYNAVRVANCLPPVAFSNIRYDSCMEQRLFWMAEDPSTDPMSAWGHIGSERSDGVPSVGCDGNLAGGSNNTGATVAQKWWDSSGHRASLYKPTVTGSMANVCIVFAMTHGGVPNEPYSFVRAAARWITC